MSVIGVSYVGSVCPPAQKLQGVTKTTRGQGRSEQQLAKNRHSERSVGIGPKMSAAQSLYKEEINRLSALADRRRNVIVDTFTNYGYLPNRSGIAEFAPYLHAAYAERSRRGSRKGMILLCADARGPLGTSVRC